VKSVAVDPERIRAAWEGRDSGGLLGKPVEVLSFQQDRIGVGLAGISELQLDDVVARTIVTANKIAAGVI